MHICVLLRTVVYCKDCVFPVYAYTNVQWAITHIDRSIQSRADHDATYAYHMHVIHLFYISSIHKTLFCIFFFLFHSPSLRLLAVHSDPTNQPTVHPSLVSFAPHSHQTAMPPPVSLLLVPLFLIATLSPIAAFPLSDLFSASSFEFFPQTIHTLPDTSVILSASTTYYIRELGLHPSVTVPSRDDQEVHLLLRVFRKRGHVVWARALTRFEAGMAVTLLSSSSSSSKNSTVGDFDIAVTGFPSFIADRPSLSVLPVCVYRATDGSLKSPCANDATVPGNNHSIVSVNPELLDTGDRRTVLMPASLIAPDYSNSMPAVVMFDTVSGTYDSRFGVVVLRHGGNRHPESHDLYGAVSATDGTACFLTSKEGRRFGRFQQLARYDLFVHCFDYFYFSKGDKKELNMRVRKLGTTASYRSPRFARITVAEGHVYIAYEQTVRRNRGFISEITVHKLSLSSPSLSPVVWISRRGQPVPRIIEMPVISVGSTAAEGGATSVAQLVFVPHLRGSKSGGVAVRLWTALNMTGMYTIRHNRVVLAGSAEYVFERPQQWLILLDERRRPKVMRVPVKSRANGAVRDVVPDKYGALVMGGSALSRSGRKLVVYGMLRKVTPEFGSGPLFTYDLHLPYKGPRT